MLKNRSLSNYSLLLVGLFVFLCIISGCNDDDSAISIEKFPPVISNLSAPDFIPSNFTDTVMIYLDVYDPDGLDDIASVYAVVIDTNDSFDSDTLFMLNYSQIDGDLIDYRIYSFAFTSTDLPSAAGEFSYYFLAVDSAGEYSDTLSQDISFDTMEGPFIYNLITPDSLLKGSTDPAYLFIHAWDSHGLDEIDSVYFTTMRPDSTSSGYVFLMYDDGAVSSHGDSTAGDGIFSLGIQSPSSDAQSGLWTFTFTARDEFDNQGNTIVKQIMAYDGTLVLNEKIREYNRDSSVTTNMRKVE